MKKIGFITIALLTVFITCAQVPQKINTWYEYQRFIVDSLFSIPGDTVKVPTSYSNYPYMAWKNNAIYVWSHSAHKWIKGSSSFDSSLANSNLRLTANRTISGNNKTFSIDSTYSIILRNGLYGSRLTMLPTYSELAYYGLSGESEVITSEGNLQLYSSNHIAFNSTTGLYGFQNLQRDSANHTLINYDSTTGIINYTPAAELFRQKATFGGSIEINRTPVSADITLDGTHYYIVVDATAASITVTLPPVATCPGRTYIVKRAIGSNHAVNIVPSGSEDIDGSSSIYLTTTGKTLCVVAGSAGWEILVF